MVSQEKATKYAFGAVCLVALLGLVLVVLPGFKSANFFEPYQPRQTVTTKKTVAGNGEAETVTTTSDTEATLVERSLGDAGLLLLRIAVVALAAFLAGAVVQRTLLGAYAFKTAGLEVPDLPKELAEETEQAIAALSKEVAANNERTVEALVAAAATTRRVGELERLIAGGPGGGGDDPEGGRR